MRVTIVAKLVKNLLLGTWIVLSSIEFFFYSGSIVCGQVWQKSHKINFSYNSMVWKILFQTNLMVTLTVLNKYLDLDIFLNLLSIFFTSQNYIIITLVNTMQ